jgi:hypothetical protein
MGKGAYYQAPSSKIRYGKAALVRALVTTIWACNRPSTSCMSFASFPDMSEVNFPIAMPTCAQLPVLPSPRPVH